MVYWDVEFVLMLSWKFMKVIYKCFISCRKYNFEVVRKGYILIGNLNDGNFLSL